MSRRPHGRAFVDPDNPSAFGICDRSGFLFNLSDLSWQYQWAGNTLVNQRLLVAPQYLDKPSEFLKSLKLRPDPLPVFNARVETYLLDETDWFIYSDGDIMETEDGTELITDEGG